MSLDQTHIVLLRPRRANHLGAVARAMKNFGMHRLIAAGEEKKARSVCEVRIEQETEADRGTTSK